jgi:glycosyltransferase involved in cell wall biosynthesis
VDLSVVIPAFNEGRRILRNLEEVRRFLETSVARWEIIVVDDGSRDDTADRVAECAEVRLLRNGRNRGKGYSVRRGMLEATLATVLFTDADLSTPIEEAIQLCGAIDDGADIAIASRKASSAKRVRRTAHRRLMAAGFRLLVKAIALRGFHDTQCGFKMFRRTTVREVFGRQRLERWGFDVEILYIARKLGLRIVEVPVSWTESAETRLRATTPLSMARDLLLIRLWDLGGFYSEASLPVVGEGRLEGGE